MIGMDATRTKLSGSSSSVAHTRSSVSYIEETDISLSSSASIDFESKSDPDSVECGSDLRLNAHEGWSRGNVRAWSFSLTSCVSRSGSTARRRRGLLPGTKMSGPSDAPM